MMSPGFVQPDKQNRKRHRTRLGLLAAAVAWLVLLPQISHGQECECFLTSSSWDYDATAASADTYIESDCSCAPCPTGFNNGHAIFARVPGGTSQLTLWSNCNQTSRTLDFSCDRYGWGNGTYEVFVRHGCTNPYGGGCQEETTIGSITIFTQPSINFALEQNPEGGATAKIWYDFPQTPTGSRAISLEWVPSGSLIAWDFCNFDDYPFPDYTGGYCEYVISPYQEVPEGTTGVRAVAGGCGKTADSTQPWRFCTETDAMGQCLNTCPEQPGASSNTCESCPDFGAPVHASNGNMRYQETDLLPGSMPRLATRTYDSLNEDQIGLFGAGWFSAFDAHIQTYGSTYRVITENNTWSYFEESGASYTQVWPGGGAPGSLVGHDDDGDSKHDRWEYTDPTGRTKRTYSLAADGHLVAYLDVPTGEEIVLSWGSTGIPESVVASRAGVQLWSWTVTGTDHIDSIATGDATWTYSYVGDLLDTVRVDGALWRDHTYTGTATLTEVRDGAGHVLERHDYHPSDHTDFPGWAITSEVADERITNIDYSPDPGLLPRAVRDDLGERVVRLTWASGLYSDYYFRPIAGDSDRVVEVRGENCSCGTSGDFAVYGYDAAGRLARKQDARGYITVKSYDTSGRVTTQGVGYTPQGCDPATDPDACRVDSTDELMTIGLDGSSAEITTLQYGDASWPLKPTSICRDSVVEPGQSTCKTSTYHATTGVELTRSVTGWTWNHATDSSVQQTQTTQQYLYLGAESAIFDPVDAASNMGVTINFDPAWVVLPQPTYSVKAFDGPLATGDLTQIVYYPIHASVPTNLRGRLAARKDPDGSVTFFDDYDPFGNVTRLIEPNGATTEYSIDSLSRVTRSTLKGVPGCDTVQDPLCDQDLLTRFTYESTTGNLVATMKPSLSTTTHAYGTTWGRLWQTNRGPNKGDLRERIRYVIDPAWGRHTSEQIRRNESGTWVLHKQTDYDHDARGRLTQVQYLDGTTEEYEHNPAGYLAAYKDGVHASTNVFTEHDGFGRVARVKRLEDPSLLPGDGAWAITDYDYDGHGNLASVTDANGNVTDYDVDDFGYTYRITSPVTGETRLGYDAAGNLTWKQDARGVTETRTYDALGRLLTSVHTLGSDTEAVTLTYARGRRSQAVAENSSGDQVVERWSYDRRGLIIRYEREAEDQHTEVVTYEYDVDGNRVLRQRGCERVEYVVDYAGRPVQITGTPSDCSGTPLVFADNISYLPYGPVERIDHAYNSFETFTHDKRYRMRAQQAAIPAGGTTAQAVDRSYSYDGAPNLLSVTDNLNAARNRSYGYDDLGRLVSATGPFNGDLLYEYDSIGNRLKQTVANPPTISIVTNYSYRSVDGHMTSLLDQVGRMPLEHDAAGNLLTDDHRSTYQYGPRNALIGQTDSSGSGTISYQYDADGRRALSSYRSALSARLVHHFYDADGTPFLEKITDPLAPQPIETERSFVFLGGRLLAILDDSGAVSRVFSDRLGFPLLVTDTGGTVLWEGEADPFGKILDVVQGSEDNDPLLRYPGQQENDPPQDFPEPTSLFYNWNRWYNPEWGQYSQGDPIGLVGGINLFAYSLSNPARFIDPTGLQLHEPPDTPYYGAFSPPLPPDCEGGAWRFVGYEYESGGRKETWRLSRTEPIWLPRPGASARGAAGGEVACRCWYGLLRVYDVTKEYSRWQQKVNCPSCKSYEREYLMFERDLEKPLPWMDADPKRTPYTRTHKSIYASTCSLCPREIN